MDNSFRNMDVLPAHNKLRQAARQPFDLSSHEALEPTRLAGYIAHTASYRLLYSTQRVDDSTLDLLQELADQSGVIEQFKMMKQGEVMNRITGYASENRRVLHTACRDIFSAIPENPEATGQALRELDKLQNFLDDLDAGRLVNEQGEMFTDLINIGIGGSDLGPRAVYLALKPFSRPNRRVSFISNIDP
ncbi:MAG: glucose-6-phosphate isomerase, partial [Desulfobulbaceae bacterium]|nr:glucose-6-phosphate isomerase [Desulfobulbaceae bacterium]